jgi:MoaA/NifB/PqqE/SkfB family radical SAM enzyme
MAHPHRLGRKAPTNVIVAFNTLCNYNCIICNHGSRATGGIHQSYWRLKDIKKYLDPIFDHAKVMNVGGCGELSSLPYYAQLLEYLATKPGKLAFATNGYAIHPESLRRQELDHIVFSIHSIQPDTYDKLTGTRDRLPQVLYNLQAIARKPRDYRVYIATVITTLNYTEPPEIMDLCLDLGLEGVRFLPLGDPQSILGKDKYPEGVDPSEIPGYLDYVKEANARVNGELEATYEPLTCGSRTNTVAERMHECTAPFQQVVIDIKGEVHPCCFLSREYSMGNLFHQDWDEIWNSRKYNVFRGQVKRGTCEACLRHCKNWG